MAGKSPPGLGKGYLDPWESNGYLSHPRIGFDNTHITQYLHSVSPNVRYCISNITGILIFRVYA